MITAGIDIGSVSTEVVITGDDMEVLGLSVMDSQVDVEQTACEAFGAALMARRHVASGAN